MGVGILRQNQAIFACNLCAPSCLLEPSLEYVVFRISWLLDEWLCCVGHMAIAYVFPLPVFNLRLVKSQMENPHWQEAHCIDTFVGDKLTRNSLGVG